MKKLVTLLLATMCAVCTWAEDFEVDGIYYHILTDKTNEVEVTSGDRYGGYSGSVTIPATVTYNGTTYSVTSIGWYAFSECSGLTSVTIPNSVTSIGISAFCECSSLTSVTIPNSVTSIGAYAFKGCSGLTSPVYNAHCFAYMPNSYKGGYIIPNGIKQIAVGAFAHCSGLTSITIPNSVTSIGDGAFAGCSGLTSVTIPNSVTSIGDYAFKNTGIYNDDSNWENGVLYISNCLIEVKRNQVAATYTIKDGTRLIADYAFAGCSRLKSVTIPNRVTSIGWGAFDSCKSLKSVIVPSRTKISDYAFPKYTQIIRK